MNSLEAKKSLEYLKNSEGSGTSLEIEPAGGALDQCLETSVGRQDDSKANLLHASNNSDHIDEDNIGETLILEFEVDSGSEVDDAENSHEELQKLLLGEDLEQNEEDAEEMDEGPNNDNFIWEEDFESFRGQREEFCELTGPKIEGTTPIDLFLQVWDQPVINMIVEQTNLYAWQKIASAAETGISARSRLNDWVETSNSEIYRLLAIFMLMGIIYRGRVDEYWATGTLGMPGFRKLMSFNRFHLLMRFLHFVDNDTITPMIRGYDRRIAKISTVLDYLNNKFPVIYAPRRELSIDESLLQWKGNLSWVQSIRTEVLRFGIKTFELCEASSGYCLKIIINAGKGMTSLLPVMGFTSSSAKIVLELTRDFLNKGYSLFMGNFFNSVTLTRFLKRNHTDVVGTLNRRRTHTPHDIKSLDERRVLRGQVTSRHCGDVSVISWKDVRLVTMVSTYHNVEMVRGLRGDVPISKPVVVNDYNKFMGGVELCDQKLPMYPLERRGMKWYIKVFERLLNISILNCYIIYCANIVPKQRKITHRMFRYKLAEELCQRFSVDVLSCEESSTLGFSDFSDSSSDSSIIEKRLNTFLDHYPENKLISEADRGSNKQNKLKRGRCVRCTRNKVKKTTNVICSACDVFLCVGQCYIEYHTLETLENI